MTPRFLIEMPVREPAESDAELLIEETVEEAAKETAESLGDTPVKPVAKSGFESLCDTPVKEAAKSSYEFLRDTPVKEAAKSSFEFLRDTPVKEAAKSSYEFLRGAPARDAAESSVELMRDRHVEEARNLGGEVLRDRPVEEAADSSLELALDARIYETSMSSVELLLDPPIEDAIEDMVQMYEEEPPWETAAGGVRVTRSVASPQALVAVVGLSYAGLPSAMALRRAGFRILGIDTSSSRLNDIRNGRVEITGADQDDLRGHLRDDEFVLTGSIEAVHAADLVLICVPTALDAQQRPNPETLRRACASVVQHARAGQTLVLTSTSYVGSTRELLVEPLAERGLHVGEDVFVAFSGERVDPGVLEHEQLRVPRVVGAVTEACFEHASQLLHHISQRLHRVSSPETAEMVKLYESTFRAVNIALAFEIADACRGHQLDPIEVTEAAATKPFGFMAHYPSAGVGGHGVGVDPHYLLAQLRERGRPATFAEEALRTLAARPRRVAMRAHELLLRSGQRLRDARVLVVGAAYKAGIADCSRAPAVEIISCLLAEGVQVDFHDPLVPVLRVDDEEIYCVDPDPRRDASGFGPEDYDLTILVATQPGYDYGWLRRCPQVLDCTYREQAGRCVLP